MKGPGAGQCGADQPRARGSGRRAGGREALEVRHGAKVGPYLVDGDGRAVYVFTADRQGKCSEAARSTCYDAGSW